MEEMTMEKYANTHGGIGKQAVWKRLKTKGAAGLPGVTDVKRYPKQIILVVDLHVLRSFLKKSLKKD